MPSPRVMPIIAQLAVACASLVQAADSSLARKPENLVNVSWGDQIMVASGDAQLDTPEKISRAMTAWRESHQGHTVLWRMAATYIDRYYEKRLSSEFIKSYYRKVVEVSKQFEPISLARRLARQNGQKFLLYMTVFDHGGPTTELYGGVTPFPWQDRFTIAHPEYQEVDRLGNPHWGVLEMAYPECRQLMVDRIKRFMEEFDADGVYVCTRTHSLPAKHADQFGFGKPIVDECRRVLGIDILHDPRFDYTSPKFEPKCDAVEKWRQIRGRYVVEFYRELRAALAGKTIYTGIPRGRYAGPPYGNRYLAWEPLVEQRLIDGLVIRVYAGKGLHPPLYVPHAQIGYLSSEDDGIDIPDIPTAIRELYGPLCREHNVKLFIYGSYGPREQRGFAAEPLLTGYMINTPNSKASAVVPHQDVMCFPGGKGTIDAWIRLSRRLRGVDGSPRVLSKYDHEDADQLRGWEWIITPDGRFRFRVQQEPASPTAPGNEVAVESREVLPVGRWTHVATVYDLPKREVRLYLDGRLDAKRTIPARPIRMNRKQDLFVGRYGGTDSHRFPGAIDEVRFTADALVFASPPSKPYSGREPHIELLYHFDELCGQSVFGEAHDLPNSALQLIGSPNGVLTTGPRPEFGHAFNLAEPASP